MPKPVDNFTVMSEMFRRGSRRAKLFPMQNFHRADLVEGGKYGRVQFNVDAETITEMALGCTYAGGVILADQTEFLALKAMLESEAEVNDPVKRFLLFVFNDYYPGGGWDDFVDSYATLKEAEAAASAIDADRRKIIDILNPPPRVIR